MTYALVDANSFYCNVETVFRPDWRGKPIIVLSNNQGCVVAANRQAIQAGIRKFTPYFQIKALCEQRGVIALPSNYELLGSVSQSMMEIIARFAPEQYVYSIDEIYLSFKNTQKAIPCLISHGHKIRKAVWKEARLPVCVGIGETLTLAKAANHAAKRIDGYTGVCAITSNEQRRSILEQMDTDSVWGVGRRISKRLKEEFQIQNALQLANMAPTQARQMFSIELERTIRELNGIPCKQWDSAKADKTQIFSTRSIGARVSDKSSLLQIMTGLITIAAAKARKQGSLCRTLLIFASNSPFEERPAGFKDILRPLTPTNNTCELTELIRHAVDLRFREGVRYYKVGVGMLDLCSEEFFQQDLFNKPHNSGLMNTLDSINARFGTNTLFVAGQGTSPQWEARGEALTPQYTTEWADIPQIQC